MHFRVCRTLALCLATFFTAAAFAGETATVTEKRITTPPDDEFFDLGLFGARFFESNFDRRAATVAYTRVALDADFTFKVARPWSFELEFYSDYTSYDFGHFESLIPATGTPVTPALRSGIAPIRDAYFVRVTALLGYELAPQWRVIAGPTFDLGLGNGANFSDSVRYGGVLAGQYVFRDGGTLALGGEVVTRLEKSLSFGPFLRFSPKWGGPEKAFEFDLRRDGFAVTWNVTRPVGLFASVDYDDREIRLSRHGSVPGGVWRESSLPVYGGVSWRINRHARLSAFGGVSLLRTVTLDDSRGQRIFKRDVDPGLFAGAELRASF